MMYIWCCRPTKKTLWDPRKPSWGGSFICSGFQGRHKFESFRVKRFFPLLRQIFFPQVLRQHDHLVSGWLLQSIWPELHLRRPLPIACRRGEWHSEEYHSNVLKEFNTYFCHLRSVASSTALAGSSTASSWTGKAKNQEKPNSHPLNVYRTSYRTAILVEMVILTTLVSTLSLTSGLGKVSWQKIYLLRNIRVTLYIFFRLVLLSGSGQSMELFREPTPPSQPLQLRPLDTSEFCQMIFI